MRSTCWASSKKTNTDSLDKSIHQSQAVELPEGKILLAFGQHGLVKQNLRQVVKSLAAIGTVQPLDQRVVHVDLQHRLRLGRLLPGLFQQARQVRAHVAFVHHDAGR